jgi:hypothetical protein
MPSLRRRLASLVAGLGLVFAVSHCSDVAGSPGNVGEAGACITNPAGDDGGGGDDAGGDDGGGDDGGSVNPCAPPDSDGIVGGCYVFQVTVDDTGFSPVILKAQNLGKVAVTLTNNGTKPHDFVLGCIPISFAGCPPQECFAASANIPPVAPGHSATSTFVTPNPEGIYDFRSDVAGDSQVEADGGVSGIWGQFVVQ